MPELPEVETAVRYLKQRILGCEIRDFWCDAPKLVKNKGGISTLKKTAVGAKITGIGRKGKNILIELNNGKTILMHQKMTGHLLAGKWNMERAQWRPAENGALAERVNLYIHLMIRLDCGLMIALSDLRKFAKVMIFNTADLAKIDDLKDLGPDPFDKNFTFANFCDIIQKRRGRVKQVLMDQRLIAGIGNIYSDEILWEAKIHPLKNVLKLNSVDLAALYKAMRKILKIAIANRGDSMSDYRLPSGEKGNYQNIQKVYRQEGKPCPRKDGGIIKRKKIGGRSAHFCETCQKLS